MTSTSLPRDIPGHAGEEDTARISLTWSSAFTFTSPCCVPPPQQMAEIDFHIPPHPSPYPGCTQKSQTWPLPTTCWHPCIQHQAGLAAARGAAPDYQAARNISLSGASNLPARPERFFPSTASRSLVEGNICDTGFIFQPGFPSPIALSYHSRPKFASKCRC